MEITGVIIAAMPPRGGVSAKTGQEWTSQDFVIETLERYPERVVFSVFGDKLKEYNIQIGCTYTVQVDHSANEVNGRWYNKIRAWKVELQSTQQAASVSPSFPAQNHPSAQPVQSIPQDAAIASNAVEVQGDSQELPF